MPERISNTSLWITAAGMTGLTAFLGYFTAQEDFGRIMWGYIPLFLLYFGVLTHANAFNDRQLRVLLLLGILLRLVLVPALPNYSDDVYRFIWDGRLLLQGLNPFEALPAHYLEPENRVPGLTPELYANLNSTDYFTIYPPIAQLNFWFAVWLFPKSVYGSIVVMKVLLFLFELGNIWLLLRTLKELDLPCFRALIYTLNPLIILEVTGNLHFEGAMIFFLLLAWYALLKRKYAWSAVAMACSIASKLLPLLFLPFLIRRLGVGRTLVYFGIIGLVLTALFLPLVGGSLVNNFGDSLNLYFQKFEFNGSLYFVARWIGWQVKGYNWIAVIGPVVAGLSALGILAVAALERRFDRASLAESWLWAIGIYLAGTANMHPWYVSMPLVLCLFTRYRFPVIWSGLIMLTYVNYSYPEYQENLWVVAAEYSLVYGVLIYELRGGTILRGTQAYQT